MTTDVINGMPRELKPCPFCNGQVSFHQDDECSGCHLIHCAKCDAFFDFATGADPENEAAELCELCALCACAWNHRTLLATAQPAPPAPRPPQESADDAFRAWERDGNPISGANGYMAAKAGFRAGAEWQARAAQPQQAVAVTDEVREIQSRVDHLKSRIAELSELLPYADGQAYYDDKRKIETLSAELHSLENDRATLPAKAAGVDPAIICKVIKGTYLCPSA